MRVEIQSSLILFPQGTTVTEWQLRIAPLWGQGDQTFVSLNHSVIGHLSLPGRGYVTSQTSGEAALVSWGQFSRQQCAPRGWHWQKLEDGYTSLVKGSGQGAKESVVVKEVAACWMAKEAAIIKERLRLCAWGHSVMTMIVDVPISLVMH